MNIVNFHGSGFEGSVEDEEVDVTVEVRSDFLFHVLVPVLKGNGVLWPLCLGVRIRAIKMFSVDKFAWKNGRRAYLCKPANVQ